MLVVKCTLGKKELTAKAEELNAEAKKKVKSDDGVDDMRDEFVNNAIILQEALLIENGIRKSVWGYIVGVATSLWVVTTIWNLVLICRYTFVPGVVAFHPTAAVVAKDDFCGAWMTVLVLRINILLAVLFFFFNLATVVQWVCDLMIDSKGFQDSVINYARVMDNKGSGLPVMETLLKAFVLRGGSDTLDSQLQGVKNRKKTFESEQASMAKQLAALDAELTTAKSEEQALKDEVLSKGGEFADQIKKMEQQGSQVVEDVEAKAKEIQEKTAEAMTELYEKIQNAIEAAESSQFMQQVKAKTRQLEAMADEAIAAAKDPEKQKELQKMAQDALQKAQQASQDVIAAASDPEKRKELEKAAEKAMEEAKKAASDAAANLQDPEVQKKLKQAAQDAMDHAKTAAKDAVEKAEKAGKEVKAKAEKMVE
jgi:DNA repair exonuclease SbcCD ATPase subunit